MRVRFFAPTDENETRDYLRLGQRIEAFWQRFSSSTQAGGLSRVAALRAELAEIHPDLVLDLLGNAGGPHVAVIRHAERLELRPLAELMVAAAPRLDAWRISVERPRQPLADAVARVGVTLSLDLAGALVRLGITRGHAFEVVVKSHRFSGSEDTLGLSASQLLVSLLLGDACFDTWIGALSVLPAPKPGKLWVLSDTEREPDRFIPIEQLVPAFDAGVRGLDAGLSEEPYHRFCERAEWTLLDVEPTAPEADYAAQDDLALCSTMLPEMLKCFLQGDVFSSRRFSKHGEVFVYLKYLSGLQGSEARLRERQYLEDRLNRALVPGGLGCVVGGGLGTRYSYVDLALAQVDAAIALLRRLLAQADLKTAWILFCDSSLRDEWVGIGDAGPPSRVERG